MPNLREEITKTFLRFTKRVEPVPGPPRKLSATRPGLGPNAHVGPYRIVRELGSGGMGQVYLALDTRLGRHVALKFLTPEMTAEQVFLRRFQQEARTASALNHPNILTIYEFAEIGGEHIIVSEFVEGVTLRSALERDVIDLYKGLDVVTQVASALMAAHAAGIIHRDLKPTNIMIRPDGYVKVIDFGLAKLTERSSKGQPEQTWTKPGSVLGTVGYMSPEQARGDEIDERSDIWSLGVVLYEIVARHPPFEGDTDHHVIVSILDDPPRPIPDPATLPPGLAQIISRALTKDRGQRYKSVGQLFTDLQSVQRGAASASSRLIPAPKTRYPYWVPLLAAGLIVAGFSVWWWPLGGKWRVLGPDWFEIGSAERVTFDGNVTLAAISPDGKQLAYSAGSPGTETLRLRDLRSRSESSLLPSSDAYGGLTFSRDSRSLFYVLRDTKKELGTLFHLPLDAFASAPPSMVLNDVDGPVAFAPDGHSFAFVRRANTSGHQESILIARDDNARDAHSVVSLPETEISSQLAWSENEQIAAVSYPERLNQSTQPIVSLYTPQGTRKSKFLASDLRSLRYPVFLDGGSLLVFAGRPHGADLRHLIEFSLQSSAFHEFPSDLAGYGSLSATADSRTLAAVRLEERSSVWVADSSSLDHPRKITPEAESYQTLAWKDDNRLIVPSARHGSINLMLLAPQGGAMQEVSNPERCVESYPSARPGQSAIVYSSNCAHGGDDFNIWRLDTRTGKNVPLTSGSNLEKEPDLSPDGKWIVYTSSPSGTPALWRVSTAGGIPSPISSSQAQSAFISPDGTKIVCKIREARGTPPGAWGVAVISSVDGSLLQRFPGTPVSGLVRWSPDGIALDYLDTRNGDSEIWRQPLAGGAPTQLTHIGEGQIIFFAWNGNGSKVAYIRNRAESDVVLFHRSTHN